jgi:uncharacterized protein YbjT (DUF2867 family)
MSAAHGLMSTADERSGGRRLIQGGPESPAVLGGFAMRIVVNTPNGNIGRSLVETLLARGAEVTLIARNPEKVRDFAARGARVVQGSIDDREVLDRAFEGAGAVFWLTPPGMRPDAHEWAIATARTAAEAVRRRDVKRVVLLSSVGAQSGPGVGPVGALLDIEKAFRAAAPDVVSLRAGFFMENLFRSLDTIVKAGAIFSPTPADKKSPTVASRDIAAMAAEELLASTPGHRTRGVHGPVDLSPREQAAILTEVLGFPVAYVEVPVEAAEKGMVDAGVPAFAAASFADMYRGIIDGRMDPAEPRSAETTTPTTFAEFARDVLRPAVLAALPEFFVAFRRKEGVNVDEMMKVIPAERAHYGALLGAGVVKHGFFSADRKQAFLILRAASVEAAGAAVKKFPLAPFVDIEIVPLVSPG